MTPGSTRSRAPWIAAAAAFAAAAPGTPVAGFGAAWLALGFGPGWIAARRLMPEAPPAHRVLFAVVTAPALVGGVAAALLFAGVPPRATARGLLAAVALAAVGEALRPAPGGAADPASFRHLHLPGVLWAAAIAALLLGNPYLPPRSDGWFHAAVVQRVALLGLPPEDPFFAGVRLLYFWGYHVWASLFLALDPRLPVFVPLVCFNLAAAAAALLGVALLTSRLGGGPRAVWLACGLATLGYSPGSWVWIVARAFTGEVRGWEEIHRLVDLGVSPLLGTMMTGTMHASMVTFADKFLVLTPFSMAFPGFALFALAWLDFHARPAARAGAALGLAHASVMFLHSVAGWAQALCAAAGWAWTGLVERRDPAVRRRLALCAAVFAVATAALLPYLWVTSHGKSGGSGLRFTPVALSTLVVAGLLCVPTGLAGLVRGARRGVEAGRLLPIALALVAAPLVVRLPENNQSKFLNLLFLLLAAPAALVWLEGLARLGRAWRVALAAAALAAVGPSAALVAWGFASERGQAVDSVPRSTAAERAAFAWARAHTHPRAAFADEGGGEDLVVRAARGSLWGGTGYEDNWGYPWAEMRLRERAVRQLSSARQPDPEVAGLLRRLGRPVVVVARRRYADRRPSAWEALREGGGYRLLFQNDEVRLFAWEPAR